MSVQSVITHPADTLCVFVVVCFLPPCQYHVCATFTTLRCIYTARLHSAGSLHLRDGEFTCSVFHATCSFDTRNPPLLGDVLYETHNRMPCSAHIHLIIQFFKKKILCLQYRLHNLCVRQCFVPSSTQLHWKHFRSGESCLHDVVDMPTCVYFVICP